MDLASVMTNQISTFPSPESKKIVGDNRAEHHKKKKEKLSWKETDIFMWKAHNWLYLK